MRKSDAGLTGVSENLRRLVGLPMVECVRPIACRRNFPGLMQVVQIAVECSYLYIRELRQILPGARAHDRERPAP